MITTGSAAWAATRAMAGVQAHSRSSDWSPSQTWSAARLRFRTDLGPPLRCALMAVSSACLIRSLQPQPIAVRRWRTPCWSWRCAFQRTGSIRAWRPAPPSRRAVPTSWALLVVQRPPPASTTSTAIARSRDRASPRTSSDLATCPVAAATCCPRGRRGTMTTTRAEQRGTDCRAASALSPHRGGTGNSAIGTTPGASEYVPSLGRARHALIRAGPRTTRALTLHWAWPAPGRQRRLRALLREPLVGQTSQVVDCLLPYFVVVGENVIPGTGWSALRARPGPHGRCRMPLASFLTTRSNDSRTDPRLKGRRIFT